MMRKLRHHKQVPGVSVAGRRTQRGSRTLRRGIWGQIMADAGGQTKAYRTPPAGNEEL